MIFKLVNKEIEFLKFYYLRIHLKSNLNLVKMK
jgi:hypothetical protein